VRSGCAGDRLVIHVAEMPRFLSGFPVGDVWFSFFFKGPLRWFMLNTVGVRVINKA
jgi:hypothetical protein